jgi:DNA-binding Lrp family transcriptional regulator
MISKDILAYLTENADKNTSEIALALHLKEETVKITLLRMVKRDKILRLKTVPAEYKAGPRQIYVYRILGKVPIK